MLAIEYTLDRASIRVLRECEFVNKHPSSNALTCLQEAKSRVPLMVESIGQRSWDLIVSSGQFSKSGFGEGVISRAYYKMRELFLTCAIDTPQMSIHLCEAPGGFVQATSEFCNTKWKWAAISIDNKHIRPNRSRLPMDKGEFYCMDIRDENACISILTEKFISKSRGGVCLITADGAVSMDHSKLEEEHLPLLLSQTRVALRCLRPGGTFVAKFFEGGAQNTMHWIAWITTMFDSVSLVKPTSSRPTNSELYLVGIGFVAEYWVDIERIFVVQAWMEATQEILDKFAIQQTKTLHAAFDRCAHIKETRSSLSLGMGIQGKHIPFSSEFGPGNDM